MAVLKSLLGFALTGLSPIIGFPCSPLLAQDTEDGSNNSPAEIQSQPRLLAFTGLRKLVAEAGRQNLLAQKLRYTLTIDSTGKPIECEYSRKFRRKATRIALCRPLLQTMTFEPARDASGQPVQATFEGVIDFQMAMKGDGYLRDGPPS